QSRGEKGLPWAAPGQSFLSFARPPHSHSNQAAQAPPLPCHRPPPPRYLRPLRRFPARNRGSRRTGGELWRGPRFLHSLEQRASSLCSESARLHSANCIVQSAARRLLRRPWPLPLIRRKSQERPCTPPAWKQIFNLAYTI